MLWFLLVACIGYLIYKIYQHFWYQDLQKKILEYRHVEYAKLSVQDKKNLRQLVNKMLNTGTTLEEDMNKFITRVFHEMEKEDFNAQGGMGLKDRRDQYGQ
jgi:hypothetical protein